MNKQKDIEGMPNLVIKRDYKARQTSNSCYTKMRPKSRNHNQFNSGLTLSNNSNKSNAESESKLKRVTSNQPLTHSHNKKRSESNNAEKSSFSQNKLMTDLQSLKYQPPSPKFNQKEMPELDEVSDDGFRKIDEELLANEDDHLNMPTSIKIKQTELTINLQEKLDEDS